MLNEPRKLVTVDASSAGQRLDNFLLRELKGVPRSRVYRLVRRGEVRVNRARAGPDYRLVSGDTVRIPPLRTGDPSPAPVDPRAAARLAERILYEDRDLLVVDKPAGLAVHAGSNVPFGVIEAFRRNRPEAPFLELVHRLDRYTSGCLILAKNRPALQALHVQLRDGLPRPIVKRYLALVAGHWPDALRTVSAPLKRRSGESLGHRMQVHDRGQAAESRFVPVERFEGATLVEVRLQTGRTHQARIHAAHSGHPIAGDYRYGDGPFNRRMRALGLNRIFLHALALGLRHPQTGRSIDVEAPVPDALQTVLTRLRDASS